jgi:hypothetical protein
MALVLSPNSVLSPLRYPVVLLLRKNLSMSLIRVLDVISVCSMMAFVVVGCGAKLGKGFECARDLSNIFA